MLCLFVSCGLFAQKVKIVEAEYTFIVPESMSIKQAEQEALRRAQIEAIANEFGTLLSQNTMSIASDRGEDFYQEGVGLVKGEWIETIGEPKFERGFYGDDMFVKCTIKGKAREIKTSKVDLDIKVLCNGTEEKFENTDFKSGDKIYLHFKSPEDGYLSVYLYDTVGDVVTCLLPYKRDNLSVVKVEQDVEYVFFSKRYNKLGLYAAEYVMGCENERDMNTLYVVYSKNEFSKPTLNDSGDRAALKHLTFDKFNSWLTKSQLQDKDMQVEKKIISITNSNL